jgi:steroid 5-alpha reductase family enzyme
MLPISCGTVRLLLTSSLQSGPWGVVGLWAIASAVVIPSTLYRQGYSFSVGYGFSVMAMALILGKVFGMSPLLAAALFYGFRLGSFLLMRDKLVPTKGKQMKAFDKSPRLQRIPFGAAVAFFYALLMTPALYAARRYSLHVATSTSAAAAATTMTTLMSILTNLGTPMAWTGAILEAIADGHKFVAKQTQNSNTNSSDSENVDKIFAGPTTGVYRISRHPNYTGEVLFWLGLLLAGIPSFGNSAIAWVGSMLGFYGIYGIMTNATKRLDGRQKDAYGGQESYDTWRAQVKAPIFPFVHGE